MIAGRCRRHDKTMITDVIPTHRACHSQSTQCIPRRRHERAGSNAMTIHLGSIAAELPGIADRTVGRCQAIAGEIDSELHGPAVRGTKRRPDLRRSTNSVRRNGAPPSIRHAGREQNRSNRRVIARISVYANEPCAVATGTLNDKRCRKTMPVRIVEPVRGV